ncbi:hypothetical protein LU196_18055, partial [Pantoea sp. Mb-10]|uniref:hypothetical protein n=1 Tax=Pantoea sp. Mb-10 TaxID=2904117 RepID=UPI001E41B877
LQQAITRCCKTSMPFCTIQPLPQTRVGINDIAPCEKPPPPGPFGPEEVGLHLQDAVTTKAYFTRCIFDLVPI